MAAVGTNGVGGAERVGPEASWGSLAEELVGLVEVLAVSQYRLVCASADFADSDEWVQAGSPTAAHWLADVADVEVCTAREWIRVGRRVRSLPTVAAAFADRRLSYSKVRTLTRVADPDNEAELAALAMTVPAGQLTVALARWLTRNTDPEDLDRRQRKARSVRWRTEPDGMVTFTLRLQPAIAAILIALLSTLVMRNRAPDVNPAGRGPRWPNNTPTPSRPWSPTAADASTPK